MGFSESAQCNVDTKEQLPVKKTISYTVKSGDTILGIINKKLPREEARVINFFIKSNYYSKFNSLNIWDKIEFRDYWDYYNISRNGETYKRSDWKNIRFFKTYDLKKTYEAQDKVREQEKAKARKECNLLMEEKEVEGILPGVKVQRLYDWQYNFLYNGTELDMTFANLESVKNAIVFIKKVINTYNNEFKEKRPKFYYDGYAICVDNNRYFLFDTDYVSPKKMRELFSVQWGLNERDYDNLVNFLNAVLWVDKEN